MPDVSGQRLPPGFEPMSAPPGWPRTAEAGDVYRERWRQDQEVQRARQYKLEKSLSHAAKSRPNTPPGGWPSDILISDGQPPERPVHRGAHSCSASNEASAARPASQLDASPRAMKRSQTAISDANLETKFARTTTIAQSVAFITCDAEAQDFLSARDRRGLMKAVGNVLEAGANIINIAFPTTADTWRNGGLVDTDAILPEILSFLDGTWDHRSAGPLLSFFSTSAGTLRSELTLALTSAYLEEPLAAIILTLDAPTGVLCTVNVSVPPLQSRARGQLLVDLADAAEDTQAGNILIGGAWADSVLFTENQVAKLSSQFQLFTNAHLCLLTYTDRDSSPMKCFPLDTGGPYALMGSGKVRSRLPRDVAVLNNLRQAFEMVHYRILA